jgi:hypothetical protein
LVDQPDQKDPAMFTQHPAVEVVPSAAETTGARRLVELDPSAALELLAGISYGRIVFTRDALPAVRPVNHLVSEGQIIIRSRLSATVAGVDGTVVAYEADDLDATRRLGWSVVVTGTARTIDDPERLAYYERELRPWVDLPMDVIFAIRPELINGYRLIEVGGSHGNGTAT